jgi:adenosylmethionine-8-amino-7-oxononanoate aminotransferase
MAVSDPVTGMHELFRELLPRHLFAERPACRFHEPCEERHVAQLRDLLDRYGNEIAAVILEPVVQGAGGMWFYSPGYLRRLRALCDEHDVLLIFDEIATGFGRSGALFAAEHAGVSPDLMCLGKSLTGGTLSLAATLATAAIAETIVAGPPGALMHGPTFMANPLACAAAHASLDLLADGAWRGRVAAIERQLELELEPCRGLPGVADVRVLGAIGVVELTTAVEMASVQPAFVDEGVWIRPFGRLVYTMPPYTIRPDELSTITRAIRRVLGSRPAR